MSSEPKALLVMPSSIAGLRPITAPARIKLCFMDKDAYRLALAKRLREALAAAEITPAELARRLKRSPQAVNGWLTTGRISKDRLAAFAKETGEDLDYLLGGERSVHRPPKVVRARGVGDYKTLVGPSSGASTASEPDPDEARLVAWFRRMKPDGRAAILTLAALLAACAVHLEKEARMYDTTDASIITATFVYEGRPQGLVRASLPGGAQCQGEYSTIRRPTEGWGLIYGLSGAALAASNASMGNHGSAVVVCDDKRTIECEYVTAGNVNGNGACRDNRGHTYRLMF